MVHKPETVYERSRRTGFIMGPEHMGALRHMQPARKPAKAAPKKAEEVTGPTFDDLRTLIETAVKEKYGKKPKADHTDAQAVPSTCWVRDVTEEHVVFEHGDKTMAAPYSISGDKVEIGEAFEVKRETTYVPV